MRQRWLRNLAVSLGVLVMGQCAFLGAETPAPLIEPYPPVESAPRPQAKAGNEIQRSEEADSAPAASLERPIPLGDERSVDPKIQPTGLFSTSAGDGFAFGPGGSSPEARPLPVAPSGSDALPMPAPAYSTPQPPEAPHLLQQPSPSAPTSQNASSAPLSPMPSAPAESSFGMDSPLPQGSIVSPGTVPMPGVVTGPMGAPLVDGYMGNDGCAPGCGAPDCCEQDCCFPGCGTAGCCDGVCCNNAFCGWNNCCCFGNRWYGSAEYLLWFIRGQQMPPLLTTGPLTAPVPGAIGQTGTQVLFGNNIYNNNPYSGMRLRFGYWFDDCHKLGLDFGGFYLGGNSRGFSASSSGVPFLARPFVDARTGAERVEVVAEPGLTGRFSAVNTFFLYGFEANLRRNFFCGCNWFIDGFAGWRMLGLNESLSMTENLAAYRSVGTPPIPAGSTFRVNDRFGTSNLFNGGQVGVLGEYRLGRWSFDLRTSVALGGTQQYVNIAGSTTSAAPGVLPMTSPGGLLALSSNIGPHTRSMVSLVEEVGLNVGYQFTNHIRGFVGYNFLFWSSVVRPAEQINLSVNPNLIPPVKPGGPTRPNFSFNGADFWVQGIQFGLDIRW